jgi:uncharacterized integral membrane protein
MQTNPPDKKLIKWVGIAISISLLAILVLQNAEQTKVTFFFWNGSAPLFVTLFMSFVLGAMLMTIVLYPGYRRMAQSERKVKELREQCEELEKKNKELQKQTPLE